MHGVIYEIAASEKPQLDKVEDLGAGYEEEQVLVETSADPISALVNYATRIDASWISLLNSLSVDSAGGGPIA